MAMYARGIGILIIFVIIAVLIATRKLPAMIALPLMALGIGVIAGIPLFGEKGVLAGILEGGGKSGAFMLYKAIIYSILGGMFARFIQDAKIAERLVKYAAEYGGENPFIVALFMSGIIVLIFTAIGGLPAIIMVGTVMFPVLLSLGVPPATVGGMMLLAFPIGLSLSPAAWKIRAEQFGVETSVVMTYSLIWAAIQAVVLVVFLSVEFLRMKRSQVRFFTVIRSVCLLLGASVAIGVIVSLPDLSRYALLVGDKLSSEPSGVSSLGWVLKTLGNNGLALVQTAEPLLIFVGKVVRALLWTLILGFVVWAQLEYRWQRRLIREFNLLTPALPLLFILVLGFGDAYGPAFMAALAYGFLTTPRERAMQRLSRAMMEGVGDVAAPIILLMGIGMLVTAAMHPTVEALISPLIAGFIPTKPLPYVIFFFLLSPLSLYRGPLNEWGLGVGVARILANFMPAPATMGAIQSVTMLQDPTTTQNVWICGYLKLDINALLFKLFFYSLVLVISGLTLSAIMFFK
jgi:H+/gluconate symporter-like permease